MRANLRKITFGPSEGTEIKLWSVRDPGMPPAELGMYMVASAVTNPEGERVITLIGNESQETVTINRDRLTPLE